MLLSLSVWSLIHSCISPFPSIFIHSCLSPFLFSFVNGSVTSAWYSFIQASIPFPMIVINLSHFCPIGLTLIHLIIRVAHKDKLYEVCHQAMPLFSGFLLPYFSSLSKTLLQFYKLCFKWEFGIFELQCWRKYRDFVAGIQTCSRI
jgi:hypothetical protein